jgi:hypothetical protein
MASSIARNVAVTFEKVEHLDSGEEKDERSRRLNSGLNHAAAQICQSR